MSGSFDQKVMTENQGKGPKISADFLDFWSKRGCLLLFIACL